MKNRFFNRGASIYEYTVLIVVVIAVIIVMRPYFQRGIMGRWKGVGDSFGFGRQYDPASTSVTQTEGEDAFDSDDDGDGTGGNGGQDPPQDL